MTHGEVEDDGPVRVCSTSPVTLVYTHVCPKCLGDESLPVRQRLMYHPDVICHISDHLLSVPGDKSAPCWVIGCRVAGEFKPMQMADHLYAAHSINMMREPQDPRRLLISEDASLLKMSEDTRQLFEQERLPYFDLVPTSPEMPCVSHARTSSSVQ